MIESLGEERALFISHAVARAIQDARTLSIEEVRQWEQVARREQQRFDTLTSMLDPGSWQRNRKAVEATTRIAEAYLAFREALEEPAR